jgi:hypothetical protein
MFRDRRGDLQIRGQDRSISVNARPRVVGQIPKEIGGVDHVWKIEEIVALLG